METVAYGDTCWSHAFRSQMTRRSLKIALSVVGCALLSLGSVAAWNRSASLPSLLQEISGDSFRDTDRPSAFDHRLKNRYPMGSSEAVLVRELSAEEFKLGMSSDAGTKAATFERLGSLSDIARRDASVFWTVDDKGRLISVSGHYSVQVP